MSDIGFLINEAAGRLKRTLSTAVSQPYLTSACQLTLQEVQKSLRDMTTLLTPFEYQLRFGVPMHSSLSPAISFARELKREASWFVEIVRGWIPPEVPSILAAWEVAFEGDGSKDDVEKDKELAGHSMMGFQLGVMWDSNDQEPNMPAIDISNSVSASRIKRSPTTTSFETAPSLVNTISTIPTTTTSTVTPSRSAAQADLAALIAVKVHILNHANSTQTPSPPQNGLTKRHLEKQLPHQPHGAHEAKYVMIFWYLQELHTGDPSLTGMFQNPPPPPPEEEQSQINYKTVNRSKYDIGSNCCLENDLLEAKTHESAYSCDRSNVVSNRRYRMDFGSTPSASLWSGYNEENSKSIAGVLARSGEMHSGFRAASGSVYSSTSKYFTGGADESNHGFHASRTESSFAF